MDGSRNNLLIPQVFYGSATGSGNFETLAWSRGVSAERRSIIQRYSNIGSSLLLDAFREPIYLSYALDGTTWAFSRTVALGMGDRGTDYLCHVLVLNERAQRVLRGDVFLLDECFRAEKPDRSSNLPCFKVSLETIEKLAQRPCGSDVHLDENILVRLIAGTLGSSALAVPVDSAAYSAAAACRSVLSVVPPDDRMQIAFCTLYAIQSATRFRLVFFRQEDREILGNIATYRHGSSARTENALASEVREWLKCARRGALPVFALSLRNNQNAPALYEEVSRWLKLAAEGSSSHLLEWAAKHHRALAPVISHPGNRNLPGFFMASQAVSFFTTISGVDKLLSDGGEQSDLLALCAEAETNVPKETLWLFSRLAWREQKMPAAAVFALGLLLGEEMPGPHGLFYERDTESAVLRSPAEAKLFWHWVLRQRPSLGRQLAREWLNRYRLVSPADCLSTAVELLAHLDPESDQREFMALLAALEEAAPPVADPDNRRDWFLGLIRKLAPVRPQWFTPVVAARWAVQEWLFPWLEDDEVPAIADAAAGLLPELLLERSADILGNPKLLRVLLCICEAGFPGARSGGNWQTILTRPAQWTLASLVADAATPQVLKERDHDATACATWLIWGASRLTLSVPDEALDADSRVRFVRSLRAVIRAAPEGVCDVALRAAFRFRQVGLDPLEGLDKEQVRDFVLRVVADVQSGSPSPGYTMTTLLRIPYLTGQALPEGATSTEGVAQ